MIIYMELERNEDLPECSRNQLNRKSARQAFTNLVGLIHGLAVWPHHPDRDICSRSTGIDTYIDTRYYRIMKP